MSYINLILLTLLLIIIFVIIVYNVILIFKKGNKQTQPNLLTSEDIDNVDDSRAKEILFQLYNRNQHYHSIHTKYVSIFFAILAIIIALYNTLLYKQYDKNLVYTIASSSFIFFVFIYIVIEDAYIKIYNSNKYILLLEKKLTLPITDIIKCGYYKSLGDNTKTLEIINLIIFLCIYFITLFGLIKSSAPQDSYIIFIIFTLIYFVYWAITSKKIYKINNNSVDTLENDNKN